MRSTKPSALGYRAQLIGTWGRVGLSVGRECDPSDVSRRPHALQQPLAPPPRVPLHRIPSSMEGMWVQAARWVPLAAGHLGPSGHHATQPTHQVHQVHRLHHHLPSSLLLAPSTRPSVPPLGPRRHPMAHRVAAGHHHHKHSLRIVNRRQHHGMVPPPHHRPPRHLPAPGSRCLPALRLRLVPRPPRRILREGRPPPGPTAPSTHNGPCRRPIALTCCA